MNTKRKRWRIRYTVDTADGSTDIDEDDIFGDYPTDEEAQHAVDEDVRKNVVGITDEIEELP